MRIQEKIKFEGSVWVLYSKDGERILGRFPSKAAALRREAQIKQIVAMKKRRGR